MATSSLGVLTSGALFRGEISLAELENVRSSPQVPLVGPSGGVTGAVVPLRIERCASSTFSGSTSQERTEFGAGTSAMPVSGHSSGLGK